MERLIFQIQQMHFLNLEGFLLTVILSLLSKHNNFVLFTIFFVYNALFYLPCSLYLTIQALMNPSIILTSKYGVLIYLVPAHTGPRRFRLPNAWAPTLVGTKLLCPSPPDRLRKSAKRWVTQVAVLHARFCAVALLERMEEKITLILMLSSIINKK